MNVVVRVTRDELTFIREALFNYYEELDARFYEAEEELIESLPDQLKSQIRNEFDKEHAKRVSTQKKPHWTQTPEGKVILANRKKRGKAK